MINATLTPETVIDAIQRLDPLPMSVNRLLEISASADGGLDDVAEVVRFDPVLSSDVLQKSNSPMYSGRERTLDIAQAVGRLGASEVLNIAMARTMRGRMAAPLPQFGLDADQLWRHSLTTSIAAETIARASRQSGLASAGLVGLIHDIGKLALAGCVPASTLMRVRDRAIREGRPMHEIETEVLGMHHGEIGGSVARIWGFPIGLQVAIVGHHPPHNSEDLLSIVTRAADRIAHHVEDYRQDPEHRTDEQTTKLVARLGLHGHELAPLYDQIIDALDTAVAAYHS